MVASPILLAVIIAVIIISLSIFLFLLLYPPAVTQFKDEGNLGIVILIVSSIFLVWFPIIIIITGVRRFFSVIQIDEDGISRSFLRKFCRLSMKWDEIYEISYFESGMTFLMFSQTRSIQGLSYWKITKIKDLIQIQLTQKNYDFVKQFIKQPIKGLTDEKMKQLKLKK